MQRTLLRQRRALLAFGVLLGLTLVAGLALLCKTKDLHPMPKAPPVKDRR